MLTIVAFTLPCFGFLGLGYLMHESFRRDLATEKAEHAEALQAQADEYHQLLGRWNVAYYELLDMCDAAQAEALDVRAENLCLAEDLRATRVELTLRVAREDFPGEGLGAKVVDLAERRAR